VAYMLQLLYPGDFPEFAVKRPQRKMPGLASEFENQAVRETERRPRTENLQSRCYCFRILERKFSVLQEHFDCTGNLGRDFSPFFFDGHLFLLQIGASFLSLPFD